MTFSDTLKPQLFPDQQTGKIQNDQTIQQYFGRKIFVQFHASIRPITLLQAY